MPSVTSKSSSVRSVGGMNTPALFTKTCKGRPRFSKSSANYRMELQVHKRQSCAVCHLDKRTRTAQDFYLKDARSTCMHSTLASEEAACFSSCTAALPRSRDLDATITCAFLLSSALAVSSPIPELPPVITKVLFARLTEAAILSPHAADCCDYNDTDTRQIRGDLRALAHRHWGRPGREHEFSQRNTCSYCSSQMGAEAAAQI